MLIASSGIASSLFLKSHAHRFGNQSKSKGEAIANESLKSSLSISVDSIDAQSRSSKLAPTITTQANDESSAVESITTNIQSTMSIE
jgi:hypothetical protein